MARFLEQVIEFNDLHGCAYFEPYVGGGGAALALLASGIVSRLYLNDADPRITAFWRAALNETGRFIERIFDVPLDLGEWHKQREICHGRGARDRQSFDLGFAAFYMNRCNRSGILTGAGPIGGHGQRGRWGVAARFSREGLAERIHWLGSMRDRITIHNDDGLEFLRQRLPRGLGRARVFTYLDPPYVGKGGRLYMNHFMESDHRALAAYVGRQRTLRWVMSYDDHTLIRSLYGSGFKVFPFGLRYSLQVRARGAELLIVPHNTLLPSSIRCRGNEEELVEASQ